MDTRKAPPYKSINGIKNKPIITPTIGIIRAQDPIIIVIINNSNIINIIIDTGITNVNNQPITRTPNISFHDLINNIVV